MDHINIVKNRASMIAQSYENQIQKSGNLGLVPKKIEVRRKDGSTFQAIRWISPETGEPNRIIHPKWKHQDDIHGKTAEEKVNTITDSDMHPNDKARHLASLGIYDKKALGDLTEHKYPGDIVAILKKEANIATKDYEDNPSSILPSKPNPDNPIDLNQPVAQKQAISDIQAIHGDNAAFKVQEGLRDMLMKKYNVTINDKWNSYESRLNRLIIDGFPKAVMAYGTGGVGKAVPLYTKILTTKGWVKMGDIKLSTKVICPDKSEAQVIGIYPQEGQRKVYEIILTNGKKTRCDIEHLWKAKVGDEDYTILSLKQIMDLILLFPIRIPVLSEDLNISEDVEIDRIKYIEMNKVQCISINHPDHLYITDDNIVTHNTYTFEKLAQHHKLIEYDPELDMEKGGDEYDYIKIGGKIGSTEMQRAMYQHRNKLIVFDDCDSMWNDDGLINVLKNTLDTSGSGKCQWAKRLPETFKGAGDDIPSSFRFEGRMLFITNLSKKQLNEAGAAPIAESRASSIDLSMDMDQTIERLEQILPHINIKDYKGNALHLTEEDKRAGLDALKEIKGFARVEQLNTRTLGKIMSEARDQRLKGESHDIRKLAIFALQEFGLV